MRYLRLLVFSFVVASLAHAEGLAIIANVGVPVNQMTLEDLTVIYLIQKTTWSAGYPIVPVNREASSPGRQYFCEQVFNRAPSDMSDYWNRLLFKGKVPPVVQNSDAAVLTFVRRTAGAIGYIDAEQSAEGVKVLLKVR